MKEFLKEASIFTELNEEELNFLAKTAHEKFYPKDSFIVRKDEAGTSLFIIRSGEVKIILDDVSGGEIPLTILGKGSFFGEMSLFDGRPRSATVIALKDTTAVEISREDFLQQITRSPEIALKIVAEMAYRFRHTDDTIKAFASKVSSEAYANIEKILSAQLE
ncbi:MAG: cyclic nucleotide-binding domain-containing protein [Candidatus Scalindua rubra]|uniref:Transcriptional regulator of Crp/Fnr family protein n=1 Tax=Candidatus Scalindua brodae TaxID=237368 RepID=A0A0B0ERQ4_9BACT|nr:MAG: transcriptional regulator of Crp/Fnr family protein [Candidatus Scalindua brodae]MBZ0109747.1 cyclic nucleotide-binding domain-containing protein [Candidatus Scalindua rubra]TWU32380.1 cAMP-activated global transcriptional regulator CRP [Candidatus Brocadiaceae bacterium S225]